MDEKCKKFRDDGEWNPNNFDIQIDPKEIPANIQLVDSSQLQYTLQRLMPLSKTIHFKYENEPVEFSSTNSLFLSTKMKINGVGVKFI